MTKINKQQGFTHLQLLVVIAIVFLGATLTFWRINKNTSSAAHISNNIPHTEILKMAENSELVDQDHDLIPECVNGQTTDCESKDKDHDFDNDGISDNEDADEDNDGTNNNQDQDNDNDGQMDEHETDSDNDGLDDNEDPDDDNDGQSDESGGEDEHKD